MEIKRKRRIFLAVKISEPLQEEILEFENDFRKLPVRWLAGKNLHVTLVPPWYEEDIESAVSKIKNTRTNPFYIEFSKVVYGPNPRSPRLVWAEGKAPAELIELEKLLENALGQKPENRPFLLHLTLARFRPEDFSRFLRKWLDENVDWKEEVKNFVLMESHLSRDGANYEVLREFEF